MKRFFQLIQNKSIIFTDGFDKNIVYNTSYEEGSESSYSKNWYKREERPIHFFRKRGKKIEEILLSNVKYSCGQEIESTEEIVNQYTILSILEITEEEAIKILKEELDFSELYDLKNK